MKTSDIKGHCQACGRIQVVLSTTGLLAQHGYTVRSGYFSGVCRGSAWLPLESQRSRLDWIADDLVRAANAQQMRAERLQSGADLPERALKRDEWTNIVYGGRDSRTFERNPVIVEWSLATSVERRMQIDLEIGECLSDAQFLRGHRTMLLELAARVHGQPLINRTAEEMAKREKQAAKSAPIPGAFRTKAAQKDVLDSLNRAFSKQRAVLMEHFLAQPREGFDTDRPGDKMYDAMPFDLHCWRDKHVELVRAAYPHLMGVVAEIERLAADRKAIKVMPVIK